jgi:hypothetical protein
LIFASDAVEHLLLGALFDLIDLVGPEAFVGLDPVVDGFELLGVEVVEAHLAALADGDDAYFAENAEVLGDGGLREAEDGYDVVDGVIAAVDEEGDDVSAAGLGDGVEGVCGGGGSRHVRNIYTHMGICQVMHFSLFEWRSGSIESAGFPKTKLKATKEDIYV